MPSRDISVIAAMHREVNELANMPPQIIDANKQIESNAIPTSSVQYCPKKQERYTNFAHQTIC
jgi:hypothetical protein